MTTGATHQMMKSMILSVINEGLILSPWVQLYLSLPKKKLVYMQPHPVDYQASHHFRRCFDTQVPGVLCRNSGAWRVVSKLRRLGCPNVFWRHPSVPLWPPSDEAIAPPAQFIVPVALPYLYSYLVTFPHSIPLQDSIEFTLKPWFMTGPIEFMVELAKKLIPVPDDQLLCSTDEYILCIL